MMRQKISTGFTIVELMIATSVFSVILLLITTGMIQISRVYQKGLISSQTQEVARNITDTLAQAIQFSGGEIVIPGEGVNGVWAVCIGNQLFSYRPDYRLVENSPQAIKNETLHAMVRSNRSGVCTPKDLSVGTPIEGTELLSPNMRIMANINSLEPVVTAQGQGTNLYRVHVRVVYGDNDSLNATRDKCVSLVSGGQFCAISDVVTIVQKRL